LDIKFRGKLSSDPLFLEFDRLCLTENGWSIWSAHLSGQFFLRKHPHVILHMLLLILTLKYSWKSLRSEE